MRASTLCLLGVVAALGALAIALPAEAQYPSTIISSAGPLSDIYIGEDLSCQVFRTDDGANQFYPGWVEPGDCGTFLYLTDSAGSTFYAPNMGAHGGTATGGIGAYSNYVLTSQAMAGSGSMADPFKVTTITMAGNVEVTEVDSYVVGREYYRTDITLRNTGPERVDFILWRAADCFLGGSDIGYGWAPGGGSIACSKYPNNSPAGRYEMWRPHTAGSHYYHESYNTVWSRIGGRTGFPDTCVCTSLRDNGAGLSWSNGLLMGDSMTFSHDTVFSLTGVSIEPAFTFDDSRQTCQDSSIHFLDGSTFGGMPGIFTYSWDFGDGSTSTSPAPVHTYANPGTYTVTLEVTDADGLTASISQSVTSIGDPDCCPTMGGLDPMRADVGDYIRFRARARDFEFGRLTYTLSPQPAEARWDERVGTFGWLAPQGSEGDYIFHVAVTDDAHPGEECAAFDLLLTVRPPPEPRSVEDTDRDGIADQQDNCPDVPNRDQDDYDLDGVGDACQPGGSSRPLPPQHGAGQGGNGDSDGDGATDAVDNCVTVANPSQDDRDLDAVGDACDVDVDGDFVVESAADRKTLLDNCPLVGNADQADADGDGMGDACDPTATARPTHRAAPPTPDLKAAAPAAASGGLAMGVLASLAAIGLAGAALVALVVRWAK